MAARIQDVWADNFEEEMAHVRAALKLYPYVAIDTESVSYTHLTLSTIYSV